MQQRNCGRGCGVFIALTASKLSISEGKVMGNGCAYLILHAAFEKGDSSTGEGALEIFFLFNLDETIFCTCNSLKTLFHPLLQYFYNI